MFPTITTEDEILDADIENVIIKPASLKEF